MEEKKISSAVIKRLPRYYRYLSELLEKGIDRISSHELSKKMNVTASQIRQDFNNFGGFGQQGYGYNVGYLHDEIGKILGLEHNYNVIIIGAGNLGRALANYGGFTKRGFQMAGIFDVDKEKIGKKINDIPVYSIEDIEVFVKEHPVHIAALTVPKDQASKIAGRLAEVGVEAFWNFASTDLKVPSHVVVENVHLAESLIVCQKKISKRKGAVCMPKGTRDQLPPLQQLVHGKKLPILVLDERWYKLFPGGVKPEEVKTLEKKCNELLKEQGKLVNEIKDLRRGKKKLMDAIVSGMNEAENDRKKEKQKKLLIETKQKIEEESDRLMEVPYEIRKTNEELLVVSITYCYDKLKEREEYLQELTQDIEVQRAEIKQKVADKVELEESVDQTYGLMHALLGREVMNVFDHYK